MLLALLGIAAVWALSALVILGAFAAASYDDFLDLVKAAMLAAVPAVWIAPAVLLINGSSIWETSLGLVLLGYSVRLLASAQPPRKLRVKQQVNPTRVSQVDAFFGQTLPLIAAALLIQAAIIAGVVRHALVAAALVAGGSAVIAWCGRAAQVAKNAGGSPLRIVATVVGAVLVTLVQFQMLITPRVASAKPEMPAHIPLEVDGINPKDIRPLDGKDLVPGVVLRPKQPPPKIQPIVIRATSRRGIIDSSPTVVKFSGEYHLFPASSRRVQPDSRVLGGTPLDAAYVSMAGGVIATEAHQPFQPAVDLTECGRIQLRLKNGEQTPASATMHLITTAGALELGTEIFGFDSKSGLVEFVVPSTSSTLLVRSIRIIFQPDPFNRSRSAKIAVEDFRFLPRVMGTE
jgi:hypothetical protein